MQGFIKSFTYVPIQLFRLNAGSKIKLRDYALRSKTSYDVLTEAGMVKPKATDPSSYAAPNGASMRPLGEFQTRLVKDFKGSNVMVYAIPEGTTLPRDLILVHEHSDHYSLQPAVEMSLPDLNAKIQEFLHQNSTQYSRQQWLETFVDGVASSSTMTGSSSTSSTAKSKGKAKQSAKGKGKSAAEDTNRWLWDKEHQLYYYYDSEGNCHWQE